MLKIDNDSARGGEAPLHIAADVRRVNREGCDSRRRTLEIGDRKRTGDMG